MLCFLNCSRRPYISCELVIHRTDRQHMMPRRWSDGTDRPKKLEGFTSGLRARPRTRALLKRVPDRRNGRTYTDARVAFYYRWIRLMTPTIYIFQKSRQTLGSASYVLIFIRAIVFFAFALRFCPVLGLQTRQLGEHMGWDIVAVV